MTDANGKLWLYGDDIYGIRNRSTDPTGDITTSAYDTVGALQSTVSPNGKVLGGNPLLNTATFTFNAYGEARFRNRSQRPPPNWIDLCRPSALRLPQATVLLDQVRSMNLTLWSTCSILDRAANPDSRPKGLSRTWPSAALRLRSSHEMNRDGPRYGRCEKSLRSVSGNQAKTARGITNHSRTPRMYRKANRAIKSSIVRNPKNASRSGASFLRG